MLKIGVIGYGKRINSVVGLLLKRKDCELVSIADVDTDRVKQRFPALPENIRYYSDAEKMLKNEVLDGVLVGTRCSTHTKYALLVAKYKLPLFLEKPVCTTYEDLEKLKSLLPMDEKTVVSFPLRITAVAERVKEIIDSGRIGKISQVQAFNNVPYGAGYYHKWYRDESETGGLFLQKATHDLDYISYILNRLRPVRVTAVKSKQIFLGDYPEGLRCKDCPDVSTCTETEWVKNAENGVEICDFCSFAKDTGNEDSGTVIVEYENGMHTVYTQNFVVRGNAGKRGARFIGYRGTVEFDFISGKISVLDHLGGKDEHFTLQNDDNHFGGDDFLADTFLDVMRGTAPSRSPLRDGILSAELCLAAKKSAEEHVFVEINN